MTITLTPSREHRRRLTPAVAIGGLVLAANVGCGSAASTGASRPTATVTATDTDTTTLVPAPRSTTVPHAAPPATADPSMASRDRAATQPTARPSDDRDAMVAVAGSAIHIRCQGRGPTTVVLISGFGDGAAGWAAVEPALAERARVCSYERPGTGDSEPATTTQTFESQAGQLDLLLSAADEPGPYVVVGHSFGGGAAAHFADLHPHDTAGVVLVDASPAGWATTLCGGRDDTAVTSIREMCDGWSDPAANPEHLDVFGAFAELDAIVSLGDIPVSVLTAADRELPPEASSRERSRLGDAWAAGQQRWASLSTRSRLITVTDSGHYVQLEQPTIVIDEIARLLP